MQPPTTFLAVAGGPSDAILPVHLAGRVAQRRESLWGRRTDADPAPLASSRRVRFAIAARRLVTGPA